MFRTFYTIGLVSFVLVATARGQQPGGNGTPAGRELLARAAPQRSTPTTLAETRPDVFGTIQGHALTSAGDALPKAVLRLRDIRMGSIVGLQMSDAAGAFAFMSIDPGSYVVEILGQNRSSVLAASDILTVNPSQMLLTSVQLPIRAATTGLSFSSLTSSATAIATMAASSGVLAVQVSGAPTCPVPTN